MTTILAFAFVIGVLVFVHELGHFLAARRVGIRVLTFSIGFGPRIFGFTRGGTDYCISAVHARRVRQDGRRDDRLARRATHRQGRRVPVQDQVGALPGPHHGPRDEPGARRDRAGLRPLPGRRRPGLPRHAPDHRWHREVVAGGQGRAARKATGSCAWTTARSRPGISCS